MSQQQAVTSFVPDPEVRREFHVSAMTMWRWDRDPELLALGWPLPVKIRKRNFRPRQQLDAFKRAMMDRAITHRGEHEPDTVTT